uniref:NADH-ubiquinone oxidoreductase chain 1 n=1 Tax=Ibidoecus plataleae TaxID=3004258 RepID=A0A9E9ETL2_9NEOP|nr:NADH dehydrogenase subunit 1 [Ibidoecus plataleae]
MKLVIMPYVGFQFLEHCLGLLQVVLLLVGVLLAVAFFSLFERKLLSMIQSRKGPNKVGIGGFLQPIADAMKLVTKLDEIPNLSNVFFFVAPVLFFFLSLMIWLAYPCAANLINFSFSIMFVMLMYGLPIYTLIFLSWMSNSKYSKIGGMRAIAQSVSYEIILSIMFVLMMIKANSTSIMDLYSFQHYTWLGMSYFPVMLVCFITFLMESNRPPFDLTEGESELVSGVFMEVGSVSYVFLFLGENSYLLFSCALLVSVFMWGKLMMVKFMALVFLVVLIRGSFPRIRYDKLMNSCWTTLLPMTIMLLSAYFMMV